MKKVSGFERLAVYSDQKTFLKSLAQHFDSVTLKEELERLIADLGALPQNNHNKDLTDKLMDMLNSGDSAVDLDQLAQTAQQAYIRLSDGQHSTQANNALDLAGKVQKLIATQDAQEPSLEQPMATRTTPPIKPDFTPIDPAVQVKLNQLLVPSGDIKELNPDGKLGPLTQKAIEKFREKYRVPGNYSLKDTLDVIKNAG